MANVHNITILEGKITECEWVNKITQYRKDAGGKKSFVRWNTLIHNGPVFPKPYKHYHLV
mgnify:CR=1 FL=1